MEDETRKLPPGWVRTFDPTTNHQFFVDTTKDPPRSIWHHPYDDEEYLATLSSEERERLEQESMERLKNPSQKDIIAAHSEDEDSHIAGSSTIPTELPPRPEHGKGKAPAKASFGRRFKDKVTGMTHEQRVEERRRIAEQERLEYETHVRIRQAMAQAAQTGQPVHLGKDSTGRDVYVEPPYSGPYPGPYNGGAYGRPGYGNGYPGSGYPGSVGYNPYGGATSYTTPTARYIRPTTAYNRPGGSGLGGAGPGLALGAGLGLLLGTSLLI